jgi:hypothetical protein
MNGSDKNKTPLSVRIVCFSLALLMVAGGLYYLLLPLFQ